MCDRCYVCNRTTSEVKEALKDQIRIQLEKKRAVQAGVSDKTIQAYQELLKYVKELKKQITEIQEDILTVKITTIQAEANYFKDYQDIVDNAMKSVNKIKNSGILANYDFKDNIETLGNYCSFIKSVSVIDPVEYRNSAFEKELEKALQKVDTFGGSYLIDSQHLSDFHMSVSLCGVCRQLMQNFGPMY